MVKSCGLWTPDKKSWLCPSTDSHLMVNAKLFSAQSRPGVLFNVPLQSDTGLVATPRPSLSHRRRPRSAGLTMDPGIVAGVYGLTHKPTHGRLSPGSRDPPSHTALVTDNSRSASVTCSSPYGTSAQHLSHVYCTRLLAAWTIPLVPGTNFQVPFVNHALMSPILHHPVL